MHYARKTFAINPSQDTISMQSGYTQFIDIIGNVFDRTLSKLDRAGLAAIYGNPSVPPGATVTNTRDSGSGSLRAALYFACDRSTDAPPVPTTVTFHIPTSDSNYNPGTGVFTIKPTFLLVSPGTGTTVDGATQTTFTGNTNSSGPEIVLDGSQVTAQGLGLHAAGFVLRDTNCAIKNLVISGFDQQGIVIDGIAAAPSGIIPSGNLIAGCYIGTDRSGTTASANLLSGVEILGGAQNNMVGGTSVGAATLSPATPAMA